MYERREKIFWTWERPRRGLLSHKIREDWRGIRKRAWGGPYVAYGGILVLLGFYLMTCFNLVSQTKSNQN